MERKNLLTFSTQQHFRCWTGRATRAKYAAVPTYAIHCIDKPLQQALRKATRPQHLLYLEAALEKILVAGPLLDDDGSPIGSMLLMHFPDRKAAVTFAAADPYALAGLFASVAVTAWRQVLPQPD